MGRILFYETWFSDSQIENFLSLVLKHLFSCILDEIRMLMFYWQEKDFKKHQYYLTLLDGGTKEYEEIEDEDEVELKFLKRKLF